MKKVLIILPTLQYGGGIVSGIKNMLPLLPSDNYEISILSLEYSYTEKVELDNCKILDDNIFLLTLTSNYFQFKESKYRLLVFLIKSILNFLQIISLKYSFENWLFKKISLLYVGYDIVVAYSEGVVTRFCQYIEAPHKIAWIHCDYAERMKNIRYNEENIYMKYNHIVCVSRYTLQNFKQIYPKLSEKSIYIYNLLNKNYIKYQATEDCNLKEESKIKILSIGRIAQVKQFHLIPSIISKMIQLGTKNFKWYLIGEGASEEVLRLQSELNHYNISDDYFSYLGPKCNPYPYIKNSDILVSTSSSEACPFVVNEARVLGVPVVSNKYKSIYEFISDNINGRICSIDEMAEILSELVLNPNELKRLKEGMGIDDYNNDVIVQNIVELFEK